MRITVMIFGALLMCGALLQAQVPAVGPPVKLDLGLGGGLSSPVGDLSNFNSSGYHFGGKIRLHGFMPLSVIGTGRYNSLPDKGNSNSESDTQTMIGVGLEYPFSSMVVQPYLSGEFLANIMKNVGSGSSSLTRYGTSVGGGVAFAIPAFGTIDASVSYQTFNLFAKEENETTVSQVSADIMLVFSIL